MLATLDNAQVTLGPRSERPDAERVDGGDFFYAVDTTEFFICQRNPVDGSSPIWVLIGGGTFGGSTRVTRYDIGTAPTQDSATEIPAGAYVLNTYVLITTPYTVGTTIDVGQPGNLTLLEDGAIDNDPLVAGTYGVPGGTGIAWGGSDLVVRTTVAGPDDDVGAGVVLVAWCQPNS